MTTHLPADQAPHTLLAGTPDHATAEKQVGWAEVLFDLVFVFAVTEISTRLYRDHS